MLFHQLLQERKRKTSHQEALDASLWPWPSPPVGIINNSVIIYKRKTIKSLCHSSKCCAITSYHIIRKPDSKSKICSITTHGKEHNSLSNILQVKKRYSNKVNKRLILCMSLRNNGKGTNYIPCFQDDPNARASQEDSMTWQSQQKAQKETLQSQLLLR